jgi:hypothetical protein
MRVCDAPENRRHALKPGGFGDGRRAIPKTPLRSSATRMGSIRRPLCGGVRSSRAIWTRLPLPWIPALSRGVMAQLLLAGGDAAGRRWRDRFRQEQSRCKRQTTGPLVVTSRRLVGVGGDDRSRAKAAASACASRARRATWTRRPSQALEGRTLKQSYVRHLPRRLADEAGFERRLHPHALRHTYAANGSRGHADSCAIRSAKPPWRHGPIAMGRCPCPRHRDDDAQGVELGGEG